MTENPFASYDMFLPTIYKDKIDKFTKSSGSKLGPLMSPFPRQIYLWFSAFLYATSEQLEPFSEKDIY